VRVPLWCGSLVAAWRLCLGSSQYRRSLDEGLLSAGHFVSVLGLCERIVVPTPRVWPRISLYCGVARVVVWHGWHRWLLGRTVWGFPGSPKIFPGFPQTYIC